MKKYINNITIIGLLLTAMATSSCGDSFLEEHNKQNFSTDYFETEQVLRIWQLHFMQTSAGTSVTNGLTVSLSMDAMNLQVLPTLQLSLGTLTTTVLTH